MKHDIKTQFSQRVLIVEVFGLGLHPKMTKNGSYAK